MKNIYFLLLFGFFTTLAFSQGYEFGLVHNGGTNFSVLATPDFTASNTDISDVGFTLVLPAGDTDVINLSQFNGRSWSATQATASQLSSLGLGDNSKDIFVMNMPPGQTILSHSAGTSFVLVSFDVSNMPTSGNISILENSNPIATGLSGAADSFYNSNIDSTTTQDYFSGLTLGQESFSFATLSIHLIDDKEVKIRIFPNPASNYLNIETSTQINKIEFYNLQGKLVMESLKTNNIPLFNLSAGTYFLKIHSNEKSFIKKIIKN